MKKLAYSLILVSLASCGDAGPDKSSGAWIADMKLCADTVKYVNQGFDRAQGLPTLTIVFRDEAGKQIEKMSRAMVGERIETVLNGKVIASPILIEPLTEGSVQLLAPPEGVAVDFAAYSKIPC